MAAEPVVWYFEVGYYLVLIKNKIKKNTHPFYNGTCITTWYLVLPQSHLRDKGGHFNMT